MAEPAVVTLYGKPDCHLCEEAEAIVTRVAAELGASYVKVDIESSPALFERFRYRIPVIEVAGGQTLDWPTTRERVRRAILASARIR
jgi:DhnA family fructose-bisphosphate aldolase class Ia